MNEPMQEEMQEESSQSLLFVEVVNAVVAHCFFSIREAASVAMADVPPALTGVSPEAQ
jgi:hypothetical protein